MDDLLLLLSNVVYYSTFVAPIAQLFIIIYASIKRKWKFSYIVQGSLIAYIMVVLVIYGFSGGGYGAIVFALSFMLMLFLLIISLLVHWIIEKIKLKSNPEPSKKLRPLWIPFALIIAYLIYAVIYNIIENFS